MDIITSQEAKRFEELKHDLLDGMRLTEIGICRAAIATYLIREGEFWKYDAEFLDYCNDNNIDKPIWNQWVVWFSRSYNFKRTKLLDWVSALRIATGGCGIELEVIEQEVIDLSPLVELKRKLDYNSKSGLITGGDANVIENLPPGDSLGDRVGKFLLETHALPSPEERGKRLDDVINGAGYERVNSYMDARLNGIHQLVLTHNGRRYTVGVDAIPAHIIEQYCKEKRITIRENYTDGNITERGKQYRN